MVHIGKKIKERADELNIGPSELGRRINTSKQNVRAIFERASMDAEQLLQISKALAHDFSEYYTLAEYNTALQQIENLKRENASLKSENKSLKIQNDLLMKVKSLTEKKAKKKKG